MNRARPILGRADGRRLEGGPIAAALILWLACSIPTALAGDGDPEFVQQLTARGLFGLAEQFCERRIALATEADQRGEWELRLADCFAQHAWSHESTNRHSLLSHAVERTTEFLQQNVVAPPLELNLRLAQIELLLVSAAAQKAILQAGRTFQPPGIPRSPDPRAADPPADGRRLRNLPAPGPGVSLDAARNPAHESPPAHAAAVMELTKAAELTEALLSQLEQIQRDLEHQHVRAVRDRARMLLATILELQSHFPPTGASPDQLTRRAELLAQQVRKSAAEDVFKWRAALLLTEILLNRRDFPAFDLQLSGLRPNDALPGQSETILRLRIRGLLRRGQAQDALREIDAFAAAGTHLTPELTCLRLECLLGMFALESLLQDESGKAAVAAEFAAGRDRTFTLTTGVWREAAGRIGVRFRQIQVAGVTAADQLDQVEQLALAGESEAARNLILRILAQLPTTASGRSRAALLLQGGQLSVQLTDWTAAVRQLQSSRELSQASGDARTAAAADLLRVYAIGQQWQNGSAPNELPAEYEAALNAHLTDFPEAETASTAREWLTRILKVRDPRLAAEELLRLVDEAPRDHRRWEWLCAAGTLLLDDFHHQLPGRAKSGAPVAADPELLTRYRQRAAAAIAAESDDRESDDSEQNRIAAAGPIPAEFSAWLHLQLVEVDLVFPGQDAIDWDQLNRRLETARRLLRGSDETGTGSRRSAGKPVKNVFFRSELLGLVVDLRGGIEGNSFASRGQSLLQAPDDEREYAATFLSGQLVTASPSAENLVLAQVAGRLVESLLAARPSVADRIPLFHTAMIVSATTGETALTQRMLDELVRGELSDDDVSRLADALTAYAAKTLPGRNATTVGDSQRKFWQILLRRSPQGSDRWLEASLQSALLARQSGNPAESLRILNVVEILYPDWGSTSRREAARRLREQNREQPE